jgi:hypothetical protein
MDAANKIRDQIIPKVRDRFAEMRPAEPRLSLRQLATMPDEEALPILERAVEKHGESAVSRALGRQARRQGT